MGKLQVNALGGRLLFEHEAASLKELLQIAVAAGANLTYANLAYANLTYVNLTYVNLTGANLAGANLTGANLTDANLAEANLTSANLTDANLTDANLTSANLTDANLTYANLADANLTYANLADAKGIHRDMVTPLRILLEQPGPIRAYKLVTSAGVGPFNGGITYEIGRSYEVADADADEFVVCGRGINLCTLAWALREWREGHRVLIAEFTREDIAAIPLATDGKFRVRRCTIVGEKDLGEIGWPPKVEEKSEVAG